MYHTKDLNSPIEVAPELDFDRIKDAVSSPSKSPSPKIDFTNNASGVIVCWDEDNIIYLDFESHTVKIPVNNKEDFNVKIYPVPAKDLINCSFNLNTTGEISFEVYDILGQLQKKENAVFNKGTVYKSIDVSNLPSGQYALVLKQSANQCTKFFTVN